MIELQLFADRDDDDDNGVPDAEQNRLTGAAGKDVLNVSEARTRQTQLVSITGDAVRIVTADRRAADPTRLPQRVGELRLQGVRPGAAELELSRVRVRASVFGLVPITGDGAEVDMARSHASISRVLPDSLVLASERVHDTDALKWLLIGPQGAAFPASVSLQSTTAEGRSLDAVDNVPLEPAECPQPASGFECRATPFVRATSDYIDRSHPESSGRSLRAEVGGRINVLAFDRKAASIRVGGPRQSGLGPIERYRGKLRMRIVRVSPKGSLPIGGSEQAALALAREEVSTASGLWSQCGVHFGYGNDIDVAIVDPPPAHLLAVGCDLGLPASGGEVRFKVGKQRFSVSTSPGQSPTQVASAMAQVIRRAGFRATLSVNPRISPGVSRTADVLVRAADGSFVPLGTADDESTLSTDPSLDVCLGEVDLSDGLNHFTDFDAIAGTVEERSLIKAFDDGDPSTIEVFIIPNFAASGRIGESFISADQSSIKNAIIIDRAAIRAGARSFTLAHELGHILLDMPGHPDDFGVDSPHLLMDADAADPTIFGPRRLTVEECERAIRQSGPGTPIPLLEPWPLYRRP